MNTEELPATTPAAPKPKRKYQRRRTNRLKPRATAAPPRAVETGEFVGLSASDCCDKCYEDGICCISGDVCVHPLKGGLQSAHQMKPEVVRKFARAKKLLRHQKVEAVA